MIAGSLLDLIGNTPLVALDHLSPEGVTIYAKLEAQNPTGSIKDRVALAMVDAANLEPGAHLLEPTSGNTGISLALVAKLRGHKLTCVMPANATPERRLVLELFGATIVDSPANEGSNGAVRLAQEMAAADPKLHDALPVRERVEPARPLQRHRRRDRPRPAAGGCARRRPRHRRDAHGHGRRVRESFPDVIVAAAEPLPGDPVMGLRSLDDGYVPPILDVSKLDRKLLVSNAESVAAVHALLEREGIFAGVSAGAVVHVARRIAEDLPGGLRRRRRARGRRLEVPLGRLLERRGCRGVDGDDALVVVPAEIRAELHDHAAEEAPNECCGVLVFKDDVAERYIRGRNRLASPYRYELEIDPEVWFLEDEGYELAVFHSHPESEPRPSRTDRELAGLWAGKPFLIYGLKLEELRAWRINLADAEELPLS